MKRHLKQNDLDIFTVLHFFTLKFSYFYFRISQSSIDTLFFFHFAITSVNIPNQTDISSIFCFLPCIPLLKSLKRVRDRLRDNRWRLNSPKMYK